MSCGDGVVRGGGCRDGEVWWLWGGCGDCGCGGV